MKLKIIKIINLILDIQERLLKEYSSDYNLIKNTKNEIVFFIKLMKYVIKYHLFSNEKDILFIITFLQFFFIYFIK